MVSRMWARSGIPVAHQVAVAAFSASGDAARFPDAGPAWAPARLYYSVVPRSAMLRFMERLREAGIEATADELRALPYSIILTLRGESPG